MANVFGILTAIVLALASFVAYKNKAAYATEISEVARHKGLLVKSEARLALAESTLAETTTKREGVDAVVVAQTAKESGLKQSIAAITSENASKTAKIEPNKVKLDEIRAKTAKVGDLKDLASKMSATNVELEETRQAIVAADAKLANLTALNNQARAQADATKADFERFTTGQSLPTLDTRIRSIYPTWGFVTLAAGNNAGVVANSTLDVVRDGNTIAKLLVTSVESSSASASIIPESLAQDVTLMVGDRVLPAVKAPAPTKPVARPRPVAPPPTELPADPDTPPAADPAVDPEDPFAPAVVDPAAPAEEPAAPAEEPAAEEASPF